MVMLNPVFSVGQIVTIGCSPHLAMFCILVYWVGAILGTIFGGTLCADVCCQSSGDPFCGLPCTPHIPNTPCFSEVCCFNDERTSEVHPKSDKHKKRESRHRGDECEDDEDEDD